MGCLCLGKNELKEGQARKKPSLVTSVCFGVYQSSANFCVIVNTGIKVVLARTVKIIFRLCFGLAANIQPGEHGRR